MNISIGELARQTGLKVPTIRYYESVGLLARPERTEGRHRRFGSAEVARLNFIRHARELGFDVADVRELLTLSEQPERSCGGVDDIARRHVGEIDRRIGKLVALRAELQRSLNRCAHGRVGDCRVIEPLAETA